MLQRRTFLRSFTLGGVAQLALADAAIALAPDGLTAIAARSGLVYGAALRPAILDQDQAYAAALRAECAGAVIEGDMTWLVVQPEPGVWAFRRADRGRDFALAAGMELRGHNLASAHRLPDWVAALPPGELKRALDSHVRTVACRYRGQIATWDVVNEAIDIRPGQSDDQGWRNSPFLTALGPGWIDLAFRAAREVDPQARLAWCDNRFEGADDGTKRRRELTLTVLRGLRERGVPVNVLASQSHLVAGQAMDLEGLVAFYREVAALGLGIELTELDVADLDLPPDPVLRDEVIAATVESHLRAVLAVPQLRAVYSWGLSDRHSVLNTKKPSKKKRADSVPSRGLPLDADWHRKPMWQAMAAAFAAAPMRVPAPYDRVEGPVRGLRPEPAAGPRPGAAAPEAPG